MQGASGRPSCNGRNRSPHMAKRRLAELQVHGESQEAKTRPSVSAAAEQSLPLEGGDESETDAIYHRPAKQRRDYGSSDQVATPDAPSLPIGAVDLPRQNPRVQTSHDGLFSHPQATIREGPTCVHMSYEVATGTTVTSSEPSTPLQDNFNQQSALQPPVMRRAAISLDSRSASILTNSGAMVSWPFIPSYSKLTSSSRREVTVSCHAANGQKRLFPTKSGVRQATSHIWRRIHWTLCSWTQTCAFVLENSTMS